MNKERIDQIKAICNAATPGKWHRESATVYCQEGEEHPAGAIASCGLNKYWNKKNAAFIAEARTALPEAIAEIERLRGLLNTTIDALIVTEDEYAEQTADKLRKLINKGE